MARAKLFAVITAALVTAGCGGAASEPTRPEAGAVARPPKTFSVGSTLVGLGGEPVKLAAPPVTPLAGWLTPAGVPSPDGRYLAYNTWRELRHDDPQLSWSDQGIEPGDRLATPSVRVFDTEDDSDELLEDGAFSLAWRSDGAVAYFRGAERDYRAAVSYVGDVVVRASLDAKPEVWSPTRGRYIVVAWAGDRLVAYREHAGEALDLVVFEGPGRMRVIAPDSALVALSPDGQQAFVEQGPAQGRPSVGVVELASGETVAELDLTKVDRRVGTVSYAGDWLGRRVVAPSATGLAVFRVGAASITLDRTFEVEVPQGLAEPRFADSSGRRITAWASEGRGGFFLDCGVESGACERVVPYPAARRQRGFPTWRRPLYNPSRPQ